jgi:hypothetical protein
MLKRMPGVVVMAVLVAAFMPAGVLAATGPDFIVQPGGGAAGVAWTQQPRVAIKTGNRTDTSATGNVSIAIASGTGTAGAVLTCAATTVALVDGIASFSGCRIDLPGVGYRLTATWGDASTDSDAFTIGGTGTKLAFTAQPTRGTPGVAFPVQPSVSIQDTAGTTVSNAPSTTVTLALGANPGGATLTCTGGLSKTTGSGVATFSGCRLDKVGVGYTLVAMATGLTSAATALFDIADRLAFTTQPAGAAGGIAFTTQPVVAVRAGTSATATHDSATVVTLSIKAATGASGAVLTCTGGLSRTAVSGVAAFTGCAIDKASPTSPANPYILMATASGLTSAESSPFAVAAGPATKLVFKAQPGNSTAGQPFPIQPVVAITDAGGNLVATGPSSTKSVTLAIGANPGSGVLTCTGGLTRTAVAGLATFSGCAISKGGIGYTLVASSSGLASATSAPFNLVTGANLTIATSGSVITWGSQVGITVRIDQAGANRPVQVQGSRDGTNWTTIATLTTDAAGNASYVYAPVTNLYYRGVFAGAADLGALTSNTTRTVVRQISILRSINHGFVLRVARGTSVAFTDTVRPARPELPPATVRFVFYHRGSDGLWRLYDQRDLVINALGKATTTWSFPATGEWYVRSQARPTPYNANSVWGPIQRFSIR